MKIYGKLWIKNVGSVHNKLILVRIQFASLEMCDKL